jgi:hypothetical protein
MAPGLLALLVIVIVVLAVAGGLLTNRRRPPVTAEGASPIVVVGSWTGSGDMIGRVASLAAVLVAFSIVTGFLTYHTASGAADNEANALRSMFDLADYEPQPQRDQFQAAAVCYARAVSHLEWQTMREGEASPVVTAWTTRFRAVFRQLGDVQSPSYSLLLTGDRDREVARRDRIAATEPAIPVIIFWLTVLTSAVSIGWIAFSLPRVRSRAPLLVALGLLTLSVSAALLVAADLDRPFAGIAGVAPQAITSTEADLTATLADHHPAQPVPCDAQGRRT